MKYQKLLAVSFLIVTGCIGLLGCQQNPTVTPVATTSPPPATTTPTITATSVNSKWEVLTPQNITHITAIEQWGQGMAKATAWSADGKMLAVMSTRGIYLYNPSTWQVESLIEIQNVENITQFWFHPNGKSLYYTLLTSPYLSVYAYDLADGGGKYLYQDFTFLSPAAFIFSADGRMFANIGKMETNERGEPSLAPQIEIREMTTGKVFKIGFFTVHE